MQTKPTKIKRRLQAYALLMTMVFLAVCLTVFASMMYWVATSAKINQRNNQLNMSQAAAEAATERVLAPMMRDYLSQTLTTATYYASLQLTQTNADGTPWPVQYAFSDITGTTGRISVLPGSPQGVLQPVGSQYAGLLGYPWYWTNVAIATPIGQPYTVSATVSQIANFCTIPIFQYAIFYNINLEMDPGAAMFVNGPVWSNAGLWAGTANLTFNSTVSAVNQANITGTDPFCTGKTDGSAPPHFNLTGQPSSANTALVMPIAGATNSNPTNVESILNIPPPGYAMGTAAAYTTNGQIYLANGADLIISNSVGGINSTNPTGTNIFIYYQDSTRAIYLDPLKPDFYRLKVAAPTGLYTNYVTDDTDDGKRCYTNVAYAGWSWVTNVSFWDYRESDTVQALQIDVAKFYAWRATNSATGGAYYNTNFCVPDKNHSFWSIWAYNSVPLTSTTLPAIRLINGIQLGDSKGLTVATPMPIYVYGDYNKQIDATHVSSGTNTTYTYPAALMGDAITILSSQWSDAYTSGTSLGSRNKPVNTTVNAACLEGIVQSSGGNYSGGVENFLRYLEDWSGGYINTYNGSIVVMFPSIYGTNKWQQTGIYYNPPTRKWGFDFNFTQQDKLPPLTPSVKKLVRVSWAAQ
jgi:hypothetical protein